ncbi:hypothetical protein B0H12DRAFT_1232789 [Mycena haematopus]|nr:hypothetical protein B0H12DRAFT_1232789 [Mycena haematopus]
MSSGVPSAAPPSTSMSLTIFDDHGSRLDSAALVKAQSLDRKLLKGDNKQLEHAIRIVKKLRSIQHHAALAITGALRSIPTDVLDIYVHLEQLVDKSDKVMRPLYQISKQYTVSGRGWGLPSYGSPPRAGGLNSVVRIAIDNKAALKAITVRTRLSLAVGTVRWTAGRICVTGNERANAGTKRVAQVRGRDPPRRVGGHSREMVGGITRYVRTMQYNLKLMTGSYLALADHLPSLSSARLTPLSKHLHRINKATLPICPCCREVDESVVHYCFIAPHTCMLAKCCAVPLPRRPSLHQATGHAKTYPTSFSLLTSVAQCPALTHFPARRTLGAPRILACLREAYTPNTLRLG